MSEAGIAIKIDNVGMVYHDNEKEVTALKGVSMDIEKGEFISLLGPSGCGKTTLLRIVADLIKPTSGLVLIDGETPAKARIQKKYGMVFQSPVLYEWRTVQKNVELPLELMKLNEQERTERAEKMLELVGLHGFQTLLQQTQLAWDLPKLLRSTSVPAWFWFTNTTANTQCFLSKPAAEIPPQEKK